MTLPPRIVLSRFDHERLERLLDKVGQRPDLDALREEIERAEVVEPEKVPDTLVTMLDWPLPSGRSRSLRVVAITYQPEAAGDPI